MWIRFWQDIRWGFRTLQRVYGKKFLLSKVSLTTTTEDRYSSIVVENNISIPMRDGIRLYANIYRPDKEGKYPVVLIRLPYGKDEYYCYMPAHGKYWVSKGYACVVQDVRGKWCSEGKFDPFINEPNDGYDTLDWIAGQPWCDGNIGMTGESYYGYTQWAVAPLNHPNLKCIVPGNTAANIYGEFMYIDHAFCLKTIGNWGPEMNSRTYANHFRQNPWHLPLIDIPDDAGIPCNYYRDWIKHPTRDSYWDPINVDQKFGEIKIPVLNWGGWYDVFVRSTINDWIGMRTHASDETVRDSQYLIISPCDHETTPMFTGRTGRFDVGKTAWTYDHVQHFYDYYLKGIDNGLKQEPHVKIFVLGDNKWRYENEWPLARTVYTKFFFHSQGKANTLRGDGSLSKLEPSDESPDLFRYDPKHPVDITLHTDLWNLARTAKDRRRVEKRADVLVYSSSILDKDLEITGPIKATIYAASTARDTDFTATLVDVFPDGYGQFIQEGIVRARYRNPQAEPSLIEPGKVYEYIIDLWATSYVVKAGHRIRVEISSSNFNRYDRNPNTGDEFGLHTRIIEANQTIYHNSTFPSHITLPIIPR
jgi:putative CocE/NonD family hydrolase